MKSLGNEQNRGQGWKHYHDHEDQHQYLSINRHIQEDVGGILARGVFLAEMRKGADVPATEIASLRNGSDNQTNSRIREPWKNKEKKLSSVANSARFLST